MSKRFWTRTSFVQAIESISLLQLLPGGGTNSQTLHSYSTTDGSRPFDWPGDVVLDGQGGVLATWTKDDSGYVGGYPLTIADVGSSGITQADFSSLMIEAGEPPVFDGNLVVGDNHTAFATDGLNVVSFDITSFTQNWVYTSSGGTLSFKNATPNGGSLIDDNASGAIQLDSIGSASTAVAGLAGIVPISLSNWAGISSGELAEFRSADGSGGLSNQLPSSPSAMPGSNAYGQRASSPCFTTTINCVIVPASESPAVGEPTARKIDYALYFLDFSAGLRLKPQYTMDVQKNEFNLELRESFRNPPNTVSSSDAIICDPSCGPDGFNYIEDKLNNNQNFSGSVLSVYQTFYVNRQQVQVFWPHRQGSTTQWFGSPKTSQLGFEPPNQNQQATTPYATHGVIQQLGVDSQNAASCQATAMYADSSFGRACSMMSPGP